MKLKIKDTIDAPLEKVFRVFSDFRRAAERVEGINRIEFMTEGPIDVGTRFRETRIIFGRESTEEMEITQFEPSTSFTVEANSCGAHFQSVFRFRPDNNRTTVEMELETRANTWVAKLMSPLGFLMAGTFKKCFLSDIGQLKLYCEGHWTKDQTH